MTLKIRSAILLLFVAALAWACNRAPAPAPIYSIAADKSYESSLFRQNCAICHGPEAQGNILDNGTKVPSLRTGEFKFHTEDEIYKQIANGGNGMTPFRDQLTERELHLMAQFVHDKLRKQQ